MQISLFVFQLSVTSPIKSDCISSASNIKSIKLGPLKEEREEEEETSTVTKKQCCST